MKNINEIPNVIESIAGIFLILLILTICAHYAVRFINNAVTNSLFFSAVIYFVFSILNSKYRKKKEAEK